MTTSFALLRTTGARVSIVTNRPPDLYVLCKEFRPTHHHSGAFRVLSTFEIGWTGQRRNADRCVGRCRPGSDWRGRDVPRSDIQEMVQRLRHEDGREDQLSGNRL